MRPPLADRLPSQSCEEILTAAGPLKEEMIYNLSLWTDVLFCTLTLCSRLASVAFVCSLLCFLVVVLFLLSLCSLLVYLDRIGYCCFFVVFFLCVVDLCLFVAFSIFSS